MSLPVPAQTPPAEPDPVLARRRERAAALRQCRPHERLFLRQLPQSRYAPYTAGEALGLSSRTVYKMLNRPRVRRAMEVFLQQALDEIGVSHASLVADLVTIKERCMQVEPVLDRKGNPTGVFQFDSHGAIAAVHKLMELMKLAPAKHFVHTVNDPNALPAPVFHISFEDGGPGDYGIEVSGKIGHDSTSGAIN